MEFSDINNEWQCWQDTVDKNWVNGDVYRGA